MRHNRTPQRPFFRADSRPLGAAWSWVITLDVASSGYITAVLATALRTDQRETLTGKASCAVTREDDVTEVIECLATEAMLAACDLTLDGEIPHRRIKYTTRL